MQLQRFKLISSTGFTGCRWGSSSGTAFCLKKTTWQGQLNVRSSSGKGKAGNGPLKSFYCRHGLGQKFHLDIPQPLLSLIVLFLIASAETR